MAADQKEQKKVNIEIYNTARERPRLHWNIILVVFLIGVLLASGGLYWMYDAYVAIETGTLGSPESLDDKEEAVTDIAREFRIKREIQKDIIAEPPAIVDPSE